jgi:hypothetical protein
MGVSRKRRKELAGTSTEGVIEDIELKHSLMSPLRKLDEVRKRKLHFITMTDEAWADLNAIVDNKMAVSKSRAIEMVLAHYVKTKNSLPVKFKDRKVLDFFLLHCDRKGVTPTQLICTLILEELKLMKINMCQEKNDSPAG